jgi:16S rRNA (adenine1518-N6/adenine1519-N6)-dimethyltransferase
LTMPLVRPKKHLGQHFLNDENIALNIAAALSGKYPNTIEIGPGMGVLTKHLLNRKELQLTCVEIDKESVAYLNKNYPLLTGKIIEADFLDVELSTLVTGDISLIGNFPYNISSQIFFSVLDNRNQVKEVVCMLQKEVAERLAAPHGSKTYGILSVLLQAYYSIEFLFKVPPGVFFPPPKVMSGVIRLTRNAKEHLACDEILFKKIVKQAFQMRRKTLRNALKSLNLPASVVGLSMLDKRAEQLAVDEFVTLTKLIESFK